MYEFRKCKFIKKLTYSNGFVIKSIFSFYMQTSEFCDCVTSAGLSIKMSVSSMKCWLKDKFAGEVTPQ